MTRSHKSSSQTLRRQRSAKYRRQDRIRLCEAQGWRCCYCGVVMEIETATTEHVQPLSMGGKDTWENSVAACAPCNAAHGRVTANFFDLRNQR